MSSDEVRAAMEQFLRYAGEIREMAGVVQKVTFDTYAQIGRLNADGKIEVGLRNGNLYLGDELELDALRNMALEQVEIENQRGNVLYKTQGELLGMNLHEIIPG